ncbi:HlyD family secretion protein [Anoxybacterium hadale]|uniref:HlyD family secretion protein n=1 Tax=Anoxybacterium hadale TaxID=3408580 RepID=A0ACD1A6X9_9FIRM|nr:HlyD family secretion protein [Clostridiales bacterium]
MQKAKKIAIVVIAGIILCGAMAGGYFIYEAMYYFKTNNASVSARTVNVMPLVSGTVASWNVEEGQDVKEGQVLGKQDLSSLISSSKVDQNALENSADSLLSKAEIKAPIDGRVVQSNVIKGSTAAAGSTVAVMADTSNLFIKANIEETDIFKVKTGQRVTIKIDAYPGKKFNGYVESIGAATQTAFSQTASLNTSGTYSKVVQLIPVRISLINDEELPLILGMNATVKISIK